MEGPHRRIGKFEELIAWQRARELAREVYALSSDGKFGRDYGLRDQIRRAAVSVMSNLAEGFDRGGRGEFHQFLVVAKGSCAEIRSQLHLALDVGYVSQKQFERVLNKAEEVSRIIGALRVSVARQMKRAEGRGGAS